MLTTVVFPNYGWVESMELDLKKAGARIIKPVSYATIDYGSKLYQEWACIVDVDTSKLGTYLMAHIQSGNKIVSI